MNRRELILGAAAVPFVPPFDGAPALAGTLPPAEAAIVAHVRQIGHILRETAPGHVRGFSFATGEDGLPDPATVWATCHVGEWQGGLWGHLQHIRPAVRPGWRRSERAGA
ncbi:hypothetical protein [Wenxinia marina]|uniref:Uncharacterized protein n=1 Tax=Wenxinia marina DSM 24838 TaxID=1123501 RepID=A0A0D0NRD2_9RHOB|nr:hypothetical protein [Wenxinia marina]KIQ70755.1 hypothetical protein Wenmar_00639 [Wenxinia marina DSM 24838]GGL80406.1 hypothetical protein GCM10011392_38760 [Wenxinia marina]